MKKANLQILIKILVSFFFLFLLLRKIDINSSIEALRKCELPLAITAIAILVSTSLALALRLFILLRSQSESDKINYPNILKLTMVGLFFNNFLPTGAGGDIAKAFFLVKGEEKKLLIGSSVLIDRFLGALTVISMGAVSSWMIPGIPSRYRIFLSAALVFLFGIIFFFTNRKAAGILYSGSKKLLPGNFREKLKTFYFTFSSYFSAKKAISAALGVSLLTQIVSIIANCLLSLSLPGNTGAGLWSFFTYIPLIWTATLIPSLGGLGVREFTYVYFFSPYMGEGNSAALSILVLLGIVIQSVIGGILLLFLKMPSAVKKNAPC
ncbi:MAG TPA: lysylphosphatidylglycerol synthase transmembrane domain-containing protein [bacterium]|nr:lysylphosphatidylglycerol synthase transmembrane domain-containing protein [bacterium]